MKDILGAACSGLCLLHCLVLPVFAASGATFVGLAVLTGESTHLLLSVLMVSVALWSFPSGWRAHKHPVPSLFAVLAFILMIVALVSPEAMEVYWTLSSGITFIVAHLMNSYFLMKRNFQ